MGGPILDIDSHLGGRFGNSPASRFPLGRAKPILHVAYWHLSDMTPLSSDVCCRGMNGPISRAVQVILRHRCAERFYAAEPRSGRRDLNIAELRAALTPSLRLDHEVICWYGYAPFQSVVNKFKNDLPI